MMMHGKLARPPYLGAKISWMQLKKACMVLKREGAHQLRRVSVVELIIHRAGPNMAMLSGDDALVFSLPFILNLSKLMHSLPGITN